MFEKLFKIFLYIVLVLSLAAIIAGLLTKDYSLTLYQVIAFVIAFVFIRLLRDVKIVKNGNDTMIDIITAGDGGLFLIGIVIGTGIFLVLLFI